MKHLCSPPADASTLCNVSSGYTNAMLNAVADIITKLKFKNMSKIPMHCQGVKCMQNGCKNQAMHKVGEYNIFNEQEETDEHKQFLQRHELTTYLCNEHFDKLMKREEFYGDISKYKHPTASLDRCPFHYCDKDPKCKDKCRYV